jgi:hypothetical protein
MERNVSNTKSIHAQIGNPTSTSMKVEILLVLMLFYLTTIFINTQQNQNAHETHSSSVKQLTEEGPTSHHKSTLSSNNSIHVSLLDSNLKSVNNTEQPESNCADWNEISPYLATHGYILASVSKLRDIPAKPLLIDCYWLK